MKKYYLILVLFLMPVLASAQSADKKQRQFEKKKEVDAKKQAKLAEKAKVRHMKIQTKDVQKRMKKSKREAKRHNANKRKPFYVRWFQKGR